MDALLTGGLSALWLGVLTSISPCPLAANIAAISFIGKRVGKPRDVFLSGVMYTAGRMLAYIIVGSIVVGGLLTIPAVAQFLQKYMNRLLGPVLLITGLFLLEIFRVNVSGSGMNDRMRERMEKGGIWGAGLLGILFALSFCPMSAALFFGSLVPLAASGGSIVLMPSLYGIGTGLPVLLFAVLLANGIRSLGTMFRILTGIELWARRITGVVFILVGVYFGLKYIFMAPLPF